MIRRGRSPYEHIHPKLKDGIERISNLVMSCIECNIDKGDRIILSLLTRNPKRLARILDNAKRPASKGGYECNSLRYLSCS